MKTSLLLTALGLALLATAPGRAQLLCTRPVEPFCVRQDATYGREIAMERCAKDLETYLAKADEFARCLREAADEAAAEAAQMRQLFECRKAGKTECP